MSHPVSRFIELPGRRIHFLSWGKPGRQPLLLIHGKCDNAHSWKWIAAALDDRFHIIAPDLRGHGDSDWAESYTLPDYVRDLAGIVESLDLRNVALVGHSLGGHIALRYAATWPERAASLCAIEGIELPIIRDQRIAPRPYPERLREWIDKSTEAPRPPRLLANPAQAEERMAARIPGLDVETIKHVATHAIVPVADQGWRWKFDDACLHRPPEDGHGIDLDEILDALACPALLAYGGASWIRLPPPARLGRIRHRRIASFPKAGHWLHHEARPAFIAALTAFLTDPSSIPVERPDHA